MKEIFEGFFDGIKIGLYLFFGFCIIAILLNLFGC